MLLCSQFVDVYYFVEHSFSNKMRQTSRQLYSQRISIQHFEVLLQWLDAKIAEGTTEMNAEEFCISQRKSQFIMENIHEYIFGYHN